MAHPGSRPSVCSCEEQRTFLAGGGLSVRDPVQTFIVGVGHFIAGVEFLPNSRHTRQSDDATAHPATHRPVYQAVFAVSVLVTRSLNPRSSSFISGERIAPKQAAAAAVSAGAASRLFGPFSRKDTGERGPKSSTRSRSGQRPTPKQRRRQPLPRHGKRIRKSR
jgi:hypothetical protein